MLETILPITFDQFSRSFDVNLFSFDMWPFDLSASRYFSQRSNFTQVLSCFWTPLKTSVNLRGSFEQSRNERLI